MRRLFQGDLLDFFIAIALCNSVRVSASDAGGRTYSADSPDEKALVEAAHRYGVSLVESSDRSCVVAAAGKRQTFKKLQTLPFDSTRKRSSVIVQDESGKISLVCKGAESELLSLISGEGIHETFKQIDDFAMKGLRTLVVARKEMSQREYEEAAKRLEAAQRQVKERKDAVLKAQVGVERKLTLLGATAVEDKLQVSSFPSGEEALSDAGWRRMVWWKRSAT